jgi:hypothetical protein
MPQPAEASLTRTQLQQVRHLTDPHRLAKPLSRWLAPGTNRRRPKRYSRGRFSVSDPSRVRRAPGFDLRMDRIPWPRGAGFQRHIGAKAEFVEPGSYPRPGWHLPWGRQKSKIHAERSHDTMSFGRVDPRSLLLAFEEWLLPTSPAPSRPDVRAVVRCSR